MGTNVVTVMATYASGKSASATITILYTPTFTSAQVSGGSLTATLTGVSDGKTVILESSNDLINWVPVQTNVVSGTLLPISFKISKTPGATLLRAVVR